MNRHDQCLEALRTNGPSSAIEVARYLHNQGYTKILERNIAHPRLNELAHDGRVKVVGEKWDSTTERNVSVYDII
jgi:hypothetical protein